MRYFYLCALCLAPILTMVQLDQSYDWIGLFVILLFAVNITCYLCYKIDKRRAKSQHKRRIPESTLHTLELFGGWPAGLLAQWHLHHKSSKTSYQITFWLIVSLHQILLLDYLINGSILRFFK